MDSKDYQSTLRELEKSLRRKQEELDGIAARKAAIQLKGMAGLTAQVAELVDLSKQLEEPDNPWQGAEQYRDRIEELETTVDEQRHEIAALSEENETLRLTMAGMEEEQAARIQVEESRNESWLAEKAALEKQLEELEMRLAADEEKQAEGGLDRAADLREAPAGEPQHAAPSWRQEGLTDETDLARAEPAEAAGRQQMTVTSPLLPNDILQRWIGGS